MPAAALPIAIIASGAATAGASIYGAKKQSGAAQDAANTQAAAAEQAGRLTRDAAESGASAVEGAIPTATGFVTDASDKANAYLSELLRGYGDSLAPYLKAGQTGLTGLTDLLGEKFSFNQDDPSYQWRMSEGQKALERSAAARGGVMGGGALKAIARYGQDYASTEYGKAFERFQSSQTNRGRFLSELLGAGGQANQQMLQAGTAFGGLTSGNIMDAGRFAGSNLMAGTSTAADLRLRGAEGYGNSLTGGANARAAGTVGSANAWAQGIGSAANSGQNATMLYWLMNGQRKPVNYNGSGVSGGDPYGG